MRVFHFVNDQFGLDDIGRRRLKIATIDELNDPFELLGIDLRDRDLRHAVETARAQFAKVSGFLCFSRQWDNPVQWSHYSAKHTGLCLGFDVPDHLLVPIIYSGTRFAVDVQQLRYASNPDPKIFERILFTKYEHWSYEAEVRAMPKLETQDPASQLYFAEFSDQLALKEVIVGARSATTRSTLAKVLGDLSPSVTITNTRLAFGRFAVVPQLDRRLWK